MLSLHGLCGDDYLYFFPQLRYVGRDVHATPATGVNEIHKRQAEQIVQATFNWTSRQPNNKTNHVHRIKCRNFPSRHKTLVHRYKTFNQCRLDVGPSSTLLDQR